MAAWSRDEDIIFREMWAKGEKVTVIAATLGRNDCQIRWRREHLKLPPRVKVSTIFTPKMVELLIRLWGLGFTSSEIAENLGVSTRAVLNKINKIRRKSPHLLERRNDAEAVERRKRVALKAVTSVANIQTAVANSFRIPTGAITGPCRLKSVTKARFIAMALSRRLTGYSLPKLAVCFNRKDHTTILHGIRKAEANWPERLAEIEAWMVRTETKEVAE